MPAYTCTITVKGVADSEPEARRAIAEALSDPRILGLLQIKQPSKLDELLGLFGWPCAVVAAYCAGALVAGG